MTEVDYQKIAESVVNQFKESNACPNGMDRETVQTMKELIPEMREFLGLYRKGKLTIWLGFWGFVALGILSLFVIGVVEKFKP